MNLEAKLDWNDGFLTGQDRLIVAAAALAADDRWQAVVTTLQERGEASLDATAWIEPRGQAPLTLPRNTFRLQPGPQPGRFYPRLAFPPLARSPRDLKPVRVLGVDEKTITVDPNHPLADLPVTLTLSPTALECAPAMNLADLFDGPGLQRPMHGELRLAMTDLARDNESGDSLFYTQPRFTHHLDAACRAQIAGLYARFLQPGMRVLDLMASWDSHLPDTAEALHVAGLGLNAAELDANPRLAERVVKDLNERPELPWSNGQFEVVFCTASIEYLIHPQRIVAEVRRLLAPEGVFVVAFSDRWFPPKAIRIWTQMHPFERVGLVAALLAQAGFTGLHGETLRGLQRPGNDKYRAQRAFSDPLFAVWGRTPRA